MRLSAQGDFWVGWVFGALGAGALGVWGGLFAVAGRVLCVAGSERRGFSLESAAVHFTNAGERIVAFKKKILGLAAISAASAAAALAVQKAGSSLEALKAQRLRLITRGNPQEPTDGEESRAREELIEQYLSDREYPPTVDGLTELSLEQIEVFRDYIRRQRSSDIPPKKEYIHGEMWSDTIGLPPGMDRKLADASEMRIALEEAMPDMTKGYTFWPSPYPVPAQIIERYLAEGGPTGWLLIAIEPATFDEEGCFQRFTGGYIYYCEDHDNAYCVSQRSAAAIRRYGDLGYPMSVEFPIATRPGTWGQRFHNGMVYRYEVADGSIAIAVGGPIYRRWFRKGGLGGELGFPLTDIVTCEDGVGKIATFSGGVIVSHPEHGTWEITGEFYRDWLNYGGVTGRMGYPLSEVLPLRPGIGRQEFCGGWLKRGIRSHDRLEHLAEKRVIYREDAHPFDFQNYETLAEDEGEGEREEDGKREGDLGGEH